MRSHACFPRSSAEGIDSVSHVHDLCVVCASECIAVPNEVRKSQKVIHWLASAVRCLQKTVGSLEHRLASVQGKVDSANVDRDVPDLAVPCCPGGSEVAQVLCMPVILALADLIPASTLQGTCSNASAAKVGDMKSSQFPHVVCVRRWRRRFLNVAVREPVEFLVDPCPTVGCSGSSAGVYFCSPSSSGAKGQFPHRRRCRRSSRSGVACADGDKDDAHPDCAILHDDDYVARVNAFCENDASSSADSALPPASEESESDVFDGVVQSPRRVALVDVASASNMNSTTQSPDACSAEVMSALAVVVAFVSAQAINLHRTLELRNRIQALSVRIGMKEVASMRREMWSNVVAELVAVAVPASWANLANLGLPWEGRRWCLCIAFLQSLPADADKEYCVEKWFQALHEDWSEHEIEQFWTAKGILFSALGVVSMVDDSDDELADPTDAGCTFDGWPCDGV